MTAITHSTDWTLFRDNLFRQIAQAARAYQTLMMQLLSEQRGHQRLRLAFGPVIMALPEQGLRVTALAARLQVSKQHCAQLLRQIEAAGYIERRADATDRRGRVVRLTDRGRQLVGDGLAVVASVDARCRELVGSAAFADLEASLRALRRGLGARPATAVAQWRDRGADLATVSTDLIALAAHCNGALMALTMARGHPGLRLSHTQMLLHIGRQGGHIQAIARSNDVSKQAIGRLVSELEALGYIERAANPRDGRSRLLFVTTAGGGLVSDAAAAARVLEQRCAGIVGAAALARLRRCLHQLDAGLAANRGVTLPQSRADAADRRGGSCLDLLLYLLWRLQAGCGGAPERSLLRGEPRQLALNQRGLALAAAHTVDGPALEQRLQHRLGERKLADLQCLIRELCDDHTE